MVLGRPVVLFISHIAFMGDCFTADYSDLRLASPPLQAPLLLGLLPLLHVYVGCVSESYGLLLRAHALLEI